MWVNLIVECVVGLIVNGIVELIVEWLFHWVVGSVVEWLFHWVVGWVVEWMIGKNQTNHDLDFGTCLDGGGVGGGGDHGG